MLMCSTHINLSFFGFPLVYSNSLYFYLFLVVGSTDVSLKISYNLDATNSRPTSLKSNSSTTSSTSSGVSTNGSLFEDILGDLVAVDHHHQKPRAVAFTFNLSYNPNTDLFVSHLQSAVEGMKEGDLRLSDLID